MLPSWQISQHWFGENERTMSTTIMAVSGNLGQLVGLGLTPFMVSNHEYITRMNVTWFIVATFGFIICLSQVRP